MLIFERVVTMPDSDVALYVIFTDSEKGHTVYLSNTTNMSVVDQVKHKHGNTRAAGFMAGDQDCAALFLRLPLQFPKFNAR